ncbi:SMI1/KNR4 family protein [Kosakonia sp. BK9b]
MSDIKNALEKWVNTCEKHSLTGHFTQVNDLAAFFPANVFCSAELNYFYKNYNPENLIIETGFTPVKIYAASELVKGQTGYRYLPANALVIGDDIGGGKPLIAALDEENTPVYANYDVGEPFRIANCFTDFIVSLAELIDLVYGRYQIFDIADDNDEVKQIFKDELAARVSPVIGSENFNAFYDYFYG